ncbi:MAG: DNA gyrase modulator, partial [Chloroflexia bacterium]
MPFDNILSAALDEAKRAGADYAEARSEDTLTDTISARNGAVERLSTDRDAGWGIHVLAGGGWGFASTSMLTPQAVRETALRAVEIARASGTLRAARSDLSLM